MRSLLTRRLAWPLAASLLFSLALLPALAQEAGVEVEKGEKGEKAPAPAEEPAPAPAEAPAASDQKALQSDYFEEVRVDVLQINFRALDRKGRPVTDLQPSDLEIELNGDPVRIAFLERNAPAEVIKESKRKAEATPKEPTQSDSKLARIQEPARARLDQDSRWIVFYFDSYLAGPRTRIKSLEAAKLWLREDRLPTDHIAVVNFTGKLDLLQPFTTDEMAVYQAMEKVIDALPAAYADRHDRLQTLHTAMERCLEKGAVALVCAQPYVNTYEDDRLRERRFFLSSLELLIKSMGSIPHIKSVIVFSDGISRVPAQDAIDVASAVLGFEGAMRLNVNFRADNDQDYRTITEAASRAKVSVSTIMPGGGRSSGFLSAAQGNPLNETRGARIDYFARSAKNFEQGLTEIALRTSGAISLNADPAKALDKVMSETEGLYTVGLYTAGSQAYRDYRFDIKVKRRGVKARHFDTLPRQRLPLRLGGDIEAVAGECRDSDRRALDLTIRVKRDELEFKKVPGGQSANFSLFITMYDGESFTPLFEEYRFFNVQSSVKRFDVESSPDPEVKERFLVPCGPLTITAVVTDAERGSMGRLTASVH